MRRFPHFALDPSYDVLIEKVRQSDQDVAQAAAVDFARQALRQLRQEEDPLRPYSPPEVHGHWRATGLR